MKRIRNNRLPKMTRHCPEDTTRNRPESRTQSLKTN
jgi:hypothetical protein